jgi:hypothetical protein
MAEQKIPPEQQELQTAALSRLERKRAASRDRMRLRRAQFPELEKERARAWRAANKERDNEISRESRRRRKQRDPAAWNKKMAAKKRAEYAKNPERYREQNRLRRLQNLEKRRAYERDKHFQYAYGITIAQRDAILSSQGGVCAICKSSEPSNVKGWHVDHCHATGKLRAILCHHCNCGIGHAKDSPEILRAMASYIEEHAK